MMRDKNIKIKAKKVILCGIIGISLLSALSIAFIFIKENSIVSYEKCSSLDSDDCWHSLAHQTFNESFCYKIKNNETREHCLEHIPK